MQIIVNNFCNIKNLDLSYSYLYFSRIAITFNIIIIIIVILIFITDFIKEIVVISFIQLFKSLLKLKRKL
jgi:hypothetical protein